jgi:hypothetical protein
VVMKIKDRLKGAEMCRTTMFEGAVEARDGDVRTWLVLLFAKVVRL